MDKELREYLDERFSRVDRRLGDLEERVAGVDQRLCHLEEQVTGVDQRLNQVEEGLAAVSARLERMDERMAGLEVMGETVQDQVRLVAEGHSTLYEAIGRHYEEVRSELRFMGGMLKNWNDLVSRRLTELERRVRELATSR